MNIIIRTRIRLFDSRSKLSCSGHCLLPPTSPIRWIYSRITAINTTTTLIHGDAGRWVLFRFIKPKLCKYQFFAKAKWEVSRRERGRRCPSLPPSPSLPPKLKQQFTTLYSQESIKHIQDHRQNLHNSYITSSFKSYQ